MLNPFKSFTQLLFFHSKISILYPVAGWFCNNEIFIQLLTINPFCNLDLLSALLWWWWWRWWIVFVVWSTDERRLALFPARTIVRDPHHREYPARRAGFEPAQNLSSGYTTVPQNGFIQKYHFDSKTLVSFEDTINPLQLFVANSSIKTFNN